MGKYASHRKSWGGGGYRTALFGGEHEKGKRKRGKMQKKEEEREIESEMGR
jgi:hypothetical protein